MAMATKVQNRAEARFTDHDALASGVQRRVKL
jgi:hypothetical protein